MLGIEPAANVAKVAVEKGFPRWCGSSAHEMAKELAAEGRCADLVLGNNVLAQVPDLNDFVEGLKILLKPEGVLTLEFPAPAATDRTQRIRHDLSRALLLLFDAHDGAHPGSSRAESVRCGGTCRRTAVRCACMPAGPSTDASDRRASVANVDRGGRKSRARFAWKATRALPSR